MWLLKVTGQYVIENKTFGMFLKYTCFLDVTSHPALVYPCRGKTGQNNKSPKSPPVFLIIDHICTETFVVEKQLHI